MNSDQLKDRSTPFTFLIITIIAYGLLLPQMGFYWDDWPFIWIAKFLGPAEFLPAFANVRPFLGPIFYVTTSLIPPVPLYWQVFMLVIRFISGLLAWFVFRQVWPHHKRQTLVAALLFLVFPGYSQHWVAFTHINQEWIPFLFYLLSFGFTAKAFRNPQRFTPNTLLALIFLIPGVFPTEYFLGLEPLRFLFMWAMISENTAGLPDQIKLSLKRWLPYLVIWLANAGWLAYFYTFGSYQSYDVEVAREPISIAQALLAMGDAVWKAGVYVWVQVIVLTARSISAPSSLVTVLLIGISFVIFFLLLKNGDVSGNAARRFALAAIGIGTVGILLGRFPSFAAGLPLKLQASNDRFMISMMIGGSLFIVGLVHSLIRNGRVKTVVFSLLIAMGIGQQFFNANIFRRDWANQQEFFWQLAWRIPAMQPNTLLLTDQLPVDHETDLSFTAPINWMYAPTYTRSAVPYALVYTEKRLGGSLPSLDPGERVSVYLRTVNFEGSTSQAVTIYMPENGCLRVLSSQWGDEVTYGRQSAYLVKAIPLSDTDRIIMHADQTARLPFLAEPEHTWCYYYAKAELARQQGDWQQVVALLNEGLSLGYKPEDPFEWLIFIEARALTGDLEGAEQLSTHALGSAKGVRKGLCQLWKRVQAQGSLRGETASYVEPLMVKFQCPP
jgi:hypothetical protein